jgi:hypothetical protein
MARHCAYFPDVSDWEIRLGFGQNSANRRRISSGRGHIALFEFDAGNSVRPGSGHALCTCGAAKARQ